MLPATTDLSSTASRLFVTSTLVVVFCAASAMLIVDWMPGASGLPADIAVIQQ